MEQAEKRLKALLEKVKRDKDILAALVFGSYARGEKYRDIDLCIVLSQTSPVSAFDKKVEYLEYERIDVSVFQELPLYIQQRVLKEGKVRFCRDEDALYDIAIKSVREFELFRPRYEMYLEGVANG